MFLNYFFELFKEHLKISNLFQMNDTSSDYDNYSNPSKRIDLKGNFFIDKKQPEYVDNIIFDFSKIAMINYPADKSEIEPSTYFNTFSPKPKFFNIDKSKKRGRRKVGAKASSEVKHDKFSSDNIKQKIKRLFIQSVKDYLNSSYNKYFNLNNRKSDNFLEKIKPINLEYFSMTLRELFSSDLGGKYTKMDKKYNKKNIDILIQKNEAKEIIQLLNKTMEEVYEIYINDEIPEFSLAHDLNIIEKKEGNYYKNKVKEIALKLIAFQKKGKK